MTMTHISTITVGPSGAASIEFTGIPQTGTDLLLVTSLRRNTGGQLWPSVAVRFNGSSAGIYDFKDLNGFGSSVNSGGNVNYGQFYVNGAMTDNGATANTFGNASFYIPNYAGSTNKSMSVDAVIENNASDSRQTITANLWKSTAAITQITLWSSFSAGYYFEQYSTASLYTISTTGATGATVS